ncbi:MAG TPA: molybdopterin-synthase adenylyltransferase MoeB [Vicinamibacterales bacterium]|nr:molybdopterin-synthase adenylyltransferase MoeB [Vicinamibacterales bacterium]
MPDLTREELTRYARHVILPDVGIDGQRRLKGARVLCVGAGGLGSPAAMYLAAAGIGTLGIVDDDAVDASNLQRQILHDSAALGRPKVESARDRLKAINPNVSVEMHHLRLTSANALDILDRYDVVLDGADNFPTRYLVNDACVLLGKPNAFGAIFRFEGQASVFATTSGPCYRCIYPDPPPPGLVPSCAEAGVFGVLPGIVGTIQATEAIKLVLGLGETLAGRLLVYDAMRMAFRELKVPKDPDCPVCGPTPTVRELIDYEAFCGLKEAEAPRDGSAGPAELGALDPIITVDELKARWDLGDRPFLLDVREEVEYRIARLEGGLLIPLGELVSRLRALDPDLEMVVYCHHGIRSAKATAYLRHNGFPRARNLRGGIEEWAAKVDPSMPRY